MTVVLSLYVVVAVVCAGVSAAPTTRTGTRWASSSSDSSSVRSVSSSRPLLPPGARLHPKDLLR